MLRASFLKLFRGFGPWPLHFQCGGQDKKSTLGMHLTQLQTEDPKLESSVHESLQTAGILTCLKFPIFMVVKAFNSYLFLRTPDPRCVFIAYGNPDSDGFSGFLLQPGYVDISQQ